MADSGYSRYSLDSSRPGTPSTRLSFDNYSIAMSLNQETMIRPVHKHDFVDTAASKKVDTLLRDQGAFAIVLTGVPGTGKTFSAEEKSAELWHEILSEQPAKIFRQFNCLSLESFYSDLAVFYRDLNMMAAALSAEKPRTWEIIQTLFEDMNEIYPNHSKIFIFDDAENIEALLNVLDHIGRKIKHGNKEDKSSKGSKQGTATPAPAWKIFVTSQKKIPVSIRKGYQFIGDASFVDVQVFGLDETKALFRYCDLSDESIKKLRDMLGCLPLALRICMKSLASDESGDSEQFVNRYLKQVEEETKSLSDNAREDKDKSALIAIKIAVERLVADLPYSEPSMQLLKILTVLNEKNISRELLVACAETVTTDERANEVVRVVTSRLIERSICTKRQENRVPLYNLHKLVKQSLQLFVKDSEKEGLITKALIGVSRILPKDGRKHQTRLVGFYADHCAALDLVIHTMRPNINREKTPFIMLLHCNLLVGMGYCLLAQRNGLESGLRRLSQARDKYCALVLGDGQTYDELVEIERRSVEGFQVNKEIAIRLYSEGQNLDLIKDAEYRSYVDLLPQYHRLTKKDLDNMLDVSTEEELVNDHLSRQKLELFKEKGRNLKKETVIDIDKLAHVFIAELLAQIFCVWSKIHGKKAEYHTRTRECIAQSEAAMEICNRIYDEFGVYLLAALITEREMLAMQMECVSSAAEVVRIRDQLDELSAVGSKDDKRFAYEAGLMRSDLSRDQYHKMVCVEWKINCSGKLFQLDGRRSREHYDCGRELLSSVEQLANKQVYKASALSYCYKNYAKFLSHCQEYGEAVLYIIKAMKQLRLSLLNGNGKDHNPELESPRFSALYSNLDPYYKAYKSVTRERGEDIKLLKMDDPDYEYLHNVVAAWRDMGGEHQPTDADTKYEILEAILDGDIQEPELPAGN